MEDGASFLLKCRNGEVEAFREFFHLYERYVYSLCLGFTYDKEESFDLCQEIFLRVFKSIERFNQDLPVKPWLRRIAVNVCLNYMKTRAKSSQLQPFGDLSEIEEHVEIENADNGNDPFIYAETKEKINAIRLALKALRPDERLAIVLRHQEGLQYGEICTLTGWPLGTLKSLLFRARRSLRQDLMGMSGVKEAEVSDT